MKLGKSGLILIITGVVLIAAFIFGMNLVQQNNTKQDLQTNLALAKQKLNSINIDTLTAQKDQITAQIAQSDAQIQDLKTQLSFSKDSIDVTDILLADAVSCNVTVLELSSPGLSSENLDGAQCETIPVSLTVNGTVDNVANFIYSLSTVFPTSTLKSTQLGISGPPSAPGPSPTPDLTETPAPIPPDTTAAPLNGLNEMTANLSLVIYNYKGE